jgi:hypothetical protein
MLAPRLGLELSQIMIGHPSAAARDLERNNVNGFDFLNIFFYHIEYDGYPSDGSADDPFYLRIRCLFSGFCLPDDGGTGPSAGEKDLRLIDGVMRALHAQPSLPISDGAGREAARLEAVPYHLSLDDINHIWATQGDLPYRLSVSYEFALLPEPLSQARRREPLVGAVGLAVGPSGGASGDASVDLGVPPVAVREGDPSWAPALRFLDDSGKPRNVLSFPCGSAPAKLRVIAAGASGTVVDLAWERWDAASGWQPLEGRGIQLEVRASSLVPWLSYSGAATEIELPARLKGQLQLTASRAWERPDGSTVRLASEPLLVCLYEEAVQ